MDKKYISDNKRVILITGDHTKWYEQAIFIVRKTAMNTAAHTDFIKEAEQIISNYMGGLSPRTPQTPDTIKNSASKEKRAPSRKQRTVFDTIVNVMIIVAATVLLSLLSRGLVGL